MNRSLTHSLPAKVVALFLMLFFVFSAALSGIFVIEALDHGIYTEGVSDYYHSDMCYSEVMQDIYFLQTALRSGSHDLNSYYYELGVCNLRFAGYDRLTEKTVFNDRNMEQALHTLLERAPDTPSADPLVEFSEDNHSIPRVFKREVNDMVFLAGVIDPIVGNDAYARDKVKFDTLYPLRIVAPVVLVASLLLATADLIFLCCAAGHRYGKDGVYLNMQDRIPLDLYLLITSLLFMLFCSGLNELYLRNVYGLILIGLLCTGCIFVLLAVLLTLCTRLKIGKWWKNTLIYSCIKLFLCIARSVLRGMRRAWKSLRITWRTALVLGAFLLFLPVSIQSPIYLVLCVLILLVGCSAARQMRQLKDAGQALAIGNFGQNVDISSLHGELREHGENLNSLGQGLSIAVEQKMRSERMKTELITNVSHDIKTPLTSIINYVDLLQKNPTPEEQAEYLAVLDRQAKRLKKLTEDLVEASKASTGNLSCALAPTDLHEILEQSIGEYEERLNAAGLEPVLTVPKDPVFIMADGRLLWRVLDNLLNNACKYSQGNTRLYVDAFLSSDNAVISLKNISHQRLNMSPDELMERFVRGDSSRNTEGSGLGLNIAKSLIELQKGSFYLEIDGDLFKAVITLPCCEPTILNQ